MGSFQLSAILCRLACVSTMVVLSEETFLPLHVAEEPNVCQRECEAELIFISHIAQRVATVFHAYPQQSQLWSLWNEPYCRKLKFESKPMPAAELQPGLFGPP